MGLSPLIIFSLFLVSTQNKKGELRNGYVIAFGIVFLVMFTAMVTSQVVQTQVIDLSEKARDFFIEATKGNIQGQITNNVIGLNEDVGGIFEDIQTQGGVLIFLQAPETIDIISTSASDVAGGANANSIRIIGLDANFTEIEEVLLLNVLGNTTTKEFIRVNDLRVEEVGTYSVSNAGLITATATTAGTIQREIIIGEGTSKSTHYTVPQGQELIITTFTATMNTGKQVDLHLKSRANANDIIVPVSPIITLRDLKGVSTPISAISKSNLKFTEKSDIWFEGINVGGGSGAQIEVNYGFVQYAIGS